MAFEDLFALPTLPEIKESILDIAEGAGLPARSWVLGRPSERWIEITARVIDRFISIPIAQAARMMFLELATDPGDPGDLSADQTPRPGWLSALGVGWYGVTRGGQTRPTGFVTITNIGPTPTLPISPFDLTFERATVSPLDGGKPTYRNTADATIYSGIGGTLVLAAGASATIPIQGEQIGTYGNATAAQINIVQTQSFGALTCSNSTPVLGSDREEKDAYIARCRDAAAALSLAGPGAKYRYAANTNRDGTPLQRFDGSGPVGITRVYVSAESATGKVTVFYADPDGPSDATDVSSANANITGVVLGVISEPIGVVPDAVTILPTVTDPNTGGPGGAAAIAVNISIVGTAKVKARPGVTGADLIVLAQEAIRTRLSTVTFPALPIGGLDQVLGAGSVYRQDLADEVYDSFDGIYRVELTSPAATTAIAEGRVPVLVSPPAITGAVSQAGLIKITAVAHGLTTGNVVQIYGVLGTVEANGTWTITVVDPNSFTLDGSTFTNAYTGGGTLSRIILTVAA